MINQVAVRNIDQVVMQNRKFVFITQSLKRKNVCLCLTAHTNKISKMFGFLKENFKCFFKFPHKYSWRDTCELNISAETPQEADYN